MQRFLDKLGLERFWQHIKTYIDKNVGDGGGDIIQWGDIQGRPDLSTVSSMKTQPIVLSKDLWVDNDQVIICEGVVEDPRQQLIVTIPDTADEDAYFKANIRPVEQQNDRIVFKCDETPEWDIAVNVFILSAAKVGEQYSGEFIWWSPHMTSNNTPEPFAASASSAFPAYPAANAFDGNNYTFYHSVDEAGAWLQFDFGEKVCVSGIRIIPYPASDNNRHTAAPKAFALTGSNDSSIWDTIYEEDGSTYPTVSPGENHDYIFKLANYRYYRITTNGNYQNSNYFVVSEIEFYKLEATQ